MEAGGGGGWIGKPGRASTLTAPLRQQSVTESIVSHSISLVKLRSWTRWKCQSMLS